MRSSRLLRGTGGSDEKNVVLSEERKTEPDSPVRLLGPGKDCVLMLTQIMFTRLVKRSRDVTTGLWELSVSGKSNLHCRYEGERETSWDLNTKIRLRIQYYLCQLPPPLPSPQTAGCDIMMGLWLQFEYSIWSFLSTRGFALQITTRSQKCLNYRYDRWLSNTDN